MSPLLKAEALLLLRTFLKTGFVCLAVHKKYLLIMGGGEFVSEKFSNFCKHFNTKISTTPAKSPWCNVMYEQDNAILTEILLKVKYDITSGILLLHGILMLKIISLMLADLVPINLLLKM